MARVPPHCVTVLTFLDYYLPGIKAGGPVTTIRNMVARLAGELRFRIVTRDRDLGDTAAYPDRPPGTWQRMEGAEVLYVPPRQPLIAALARPLKDEPFDVIYINSFFSPRFSLTPLVLRRLGLLQRSPVIVAPRGELAGGALGLSPWRKRACLALARRFRLHADVVWQASSEFEAEDIRREFGRSARVVVAPNLAAGAPTHGLMTQPPEKRPGRLSVAFLARISPTKNLLTALALLEGLVGEISFSIYGPAEDGPYWEACRAAIRRLPANIRAEYRGVVPADRVLETLAGHDLLLLPTLGENFGHVILEALRAGCPVLISDRTPWRDLERHAAGWEFPLECAARFRIALQHAVDMDEGPYRRLRDGAQALAAKVCRDDEALARNRRLFETVLCVSDGGPRLRKAA